MGDVLMGSLIKKSFLHLVAISISWIWVVNSRQAQAQTRSSTTTVSGPSCGQADDGLIHTPPVYDSFAPPAEGQSYVDPQYGCTVTRLTDSMLDTPVVPRHHYYSTLTPFNANSSLIMVFLDSGTNEIRDMRGNIVVPTAGMPASNTGVEPWDPKS